MTRGPARAAADRADASSVGEAAAPPPAVPLVAELLDIRATEGLARVAGRAVALSARELELLVVLAGSAGHVVSREELYAGAWGGALRPGDRIVDVYVRKLRVKLERANPSLPPCAWIHTHVGFGYRLDPQWV